MCVKRIYRWESLSWVWIENPYLNYSLIHSASSYCYETPFLDVCDADDSQTHGAGGAEHLHDEYLET
jgi:hypothetical protein